MHHTHVLSCAACDTPTQAQFESNLGQLTSMGFDRKAAGEALLRTNNHLQAAVDLLVSGR